MKTLYFDCFSGASGDMLLGALLDLGLPIEELRRALGSLAPVECEVAVERVTRGGIGASKFRVIEHAAEGHRHESSQEPTHRHGTHGHDAGGHEHAHGEDGHSHEHAGDRDRQRRGHGHRTVGEIVAIIERSALAPVSKNRAISLFERLARVEAGIHRMPVEQVHLHEVGALDSIVDIVGGVFALDWFGADKVVSSPLNVGRGTVRTAHGVLPVPAPATAELLRGVPIYASGPEMELVTPTGALLVTAYAEDYGALPAMRVERIGYGAGDRDPRERANVLRVFIGETTAQPTTERVVVLECEIDDMNPQIFGVVMEQVLAAGALDVFYAPVQMKKNRPATLVTVVARPADREALAAILFRETTTIGLRYQEVTRERLERATVVVETRLGPVRFKVASRDGRVVNAAPEFDDCARLARERELAVKDVQAIAMKAYLESR
ncbi:MAG: nickel pincer cofactor biosynthesis protein LarC [Bacteroidales bacterium]